MPKCFGEGVCNDEGYICYFLTDVIKFYWLMLLLYPGELYRLLGASSFYWYLSKSDIEFFFFFYWYRRLTILWVPILSVVVQTWTDYKKFLFHHGSSLVKCYCHTFQRFTENRSGTVCRIGWICSWAMGWHRTWFARRWLLNY